jgi:hypothetical protein
MSETKTTNKSVGRPRIIDDDTLKKLERAFSVGATDTEACEHAGISRPTLYSYIKDNPSYIEKVEDYRSRLPFKAKLELATAITNGDLNSVKYYLDKLEKRNELAQKNEEYSIELEKLARLELDRLYNIRTYREDELDRVSEYAYCIAQVQLMRKKLASEGETLISEKTGGAYTNPVYNQLQSVQSRMDKLRDKLYPPNVEIQAKVKDIRDEFL